LQNTTLEEGDCERKRFGPSCNATGGECWISSAALYVYWKQGVLIILISALCSFIRSFASFRRKKNDKATKTIQVGISF
jgi:hypothetical protein